MPAGDRTGPTGAGPMTGRRMGVCTETANVGFGRGCGRGAGRGMGRGFGFRAAQPVSKADQLTALKAQMAHIQQQIDALGED